MSLARRSGASFSQDEDPKPDLSPMIDCVFILLIFFIVTTVFQKPPGVEVERPDASEGSVLDKNSILIAVVSDVEKQCLEAGVMKGKVTRATR